MSRARNIKPGFFRNEVLVELPFEYRLLFIGLWTVADREGRFEDRPLKIKMDVFPADDVDVDAGLQALHDKGFILRYEAAGKRYCQVLAWAKHQNPHVKEAKSIIPVPGKHDASTVQAEEVPVQAGLNPDSGFTDSGFTDSKPLAPAAPQKRATQMPAGFDLSDEMRQFARENGVADPVREFAAFRDYHTAKGSTFKNWEAAWRTWVHNAQKFGQRGKGKAPPAGYLNETHDDLLAALQRQTGEVQ